MFVRTKVSRQNYRLGRSVSRIARPSGLSYHPGSLPSSSTLPFCIQQFSTGPQPEPWRRPSQSLTNPNYQSERGLATAVGSHFTTTLPDSEPRLYEMRSMDPSMITILKEPRRPAPLRRANNQGVSGDLEVSTSVFKACIRVGKLERAAMVLKRVGLLGDLDPEELMEMNNQYLEASIQQIKADPGLNKADDLHAWYETHIHAYHLPQTPDTIAYMLKASLLTTSPNGTRLERLIQRYMSMVPPEQGLDVLYCTDILNDSDIAIITGYHPEFNVPTFRSDDGPPQDVDADTSISKGNTGAYGDSAIPEVLATPQKGLGLQTIKNTLEIFQKMKDGYDISTLPLNERREFQSRLERDCIDMAIQRWRETDENLKKMGLNTAVSSGSLNSMLWTWQKDLEARLEREFELIQKADKAVKKNEAESERCNYGPILLQSSPTRLAAVAILSTLGSLAFNGADKGAPLSILLTHIAKVVEDDIHNMQWATDRKAASKKARLDWLQARKATAGESAPINSNVEQSPPKLATRDVPSDRSNPWPLPVKMKVGAILLSSLSEVAKVRVVREDPATLEKVSSMQPAFTRCHQFKRGKKTGVVMAHPVLAEIMRKEPKGDFLARHLPMVVEPDPWVKFDKGGYRESPVPLVRIKPGEQDQRLYTEAALARGDLEQIRKGLDVLGKTAWRINRPVFDVMLEAWNSGEAIGKIPPLNPDLPAPPEPEASTDPLVRRNWIKTIKTIENQKMSYHSVRCYMNFQLEIARAYRDQEFYFPHNIDFRGRAYPVPTYMNHMGADHMRGLLRFSKGRELGERGLMWLKVHMANVYGYDKASLKDRELFATQNTANILDSANNPLNGDRWWLQAEDPWQCLSTCFELKAALESPDPTKFVSSLPVHQDGTCNGLQHYAALGGDSWGARQVNLAPGDKPADVYSAVADLVREEVNKDAEDGNLLARAMKDKIKRKVVKQTVMTNVYGVTFSGAKKQVLRQIESLYPTIEKESGMEPGLIASYITTKIFRALSNMFRGAHDIQYWLGEIGGRVCRALTAEQINQVIGDGIEPAHGATKAKKLVSKEDISALFRSTIIWTTPLRMPIVQPYRKNTTKTIHTCMQSLILQNPNRFDPVDRRKQLQAFPPNFIHSLDASHMMLSALECYELGLSFAAVHDSFWTHAADVDVMNRVLRDAFIRIHSEDVIQRLLSEFEVRYKGGLYMAEVDLKSDAGQAIAGWRKLFKRSGGRAELILEKKRIDLLNSDDPAKRQEGLEMETPGSLYAKYASETGADVVGEDLSGTTLGSISNTTSPALDEAAVEGAIADEDDDAGGPMETAIEFDSGVTSTPESGDNTDYVEKYTKRSHFENKLNGIQMETKRPAKRTTQVWIPLTFPTIPKKGDFDVTKLRESEYFFS